MRVSQNMPFAVVIRDADRHIGATAHGATQQEAQQVANDIALYMDAPLVILGRAKELSDRPLGPLGSPQWRVIHEGTRKLLTRAEIDDLVLALEFTE